MCRQYDLCILLIDYEQSCRENWPLHEGQIEHILPVGHFVRRITLFLSGET
jgi:hypothetical protein